MIHIEMITGSEIKDSPTQDIKAAGLMVTLWRRLSVRLILLAGVLLFFVALGIDSLQQAAAADMPPDDLAPLTMNAFTAFSSSSEGTEVVETTHLPGSYLDFDAETANRWRRGDLLRSQLTRSRLTKAHLFAPDL